MLVEEKGGVKRESKNGQSMYYGVNYVSPLPNSYVEILTPSNQIVRPYLEILVFTEVIK